MLKRIEVEGFKSIKELRLDLNPLNLLIGANGAGKSNFVSLFKLLNQVVDQRFQLSVRQGGGADTFLYFGRKHTAKIRVQLDFGQNGYECEWVPTADGSFAFSNEAGFFLGAGYTKPYWDNYGSGHAESAIPNEAAERGRIPKYVLSKLRSWKVYHFHDTSDTAAVKSIGEKNDDLYLRPDAANLAAFLARMQKANRTNYDSIRDVIRQVAPFFDDFILRSLPDSENKIRLEWMERGSDYPFLAYHLSDGTLRFICLATLLLQPVLPSTILIDEPELGLHPYAITVLASLMRSAASRTQVIASTQSVSLVNEFGPNDLIIVNRIENASRFDRLDEVQLSEWLKAYSLGDLWQKNVFGGRPAR